MNDDTVQYDSDRQCAPLELRGVQTSGHDEELAGLARAIAHPARLRILRLLGTRRTCICGEIVDELPFAQSTVSEHLRILKEAGLIQGAVDGPRVCYCLNPVTLSRLKALVNGL
jgi:DNA-binding transcriptional ArsR family regulator